MPGDTSELGFTQDGTPDYIPVQFDLGGSNTDRNSRFIGAQSFLNGPLELVPTRGKIQSRGGTSFVLNGDGTADLWTDVSGNDRVGLTGQRIEWQDKELTETTNAKMELTNSSGNTGYLRLDGAILQSGGVRAYLKVTTSTTQDDIIELRTGNSGSADDTKVNLKGNVLVLDGKTQVTIQNYSGGAADASIIVGASSVDLTGPSGGKITAQTKVRIEGSLNDATASSTNHPFDIGPVSTSTGNARLKLGPSTIQSVDGTATNALKLNPSGGAILGRTYQIAPVRAISGAMSGSPPAATSTTAEVYMQCGKAAGLSFTAGAATLTFPTAFSNGLIAFYGTVLANTHSVTLAYTAASASSVTLYCTYGATYDTAFASTTDIAWFAIGW